ncbi:MAG: hypothetical protein GJV46_16525 [Geobacter sp.]|nr:hypothetical protein [Geobacter sp.]
MDPLNYLLIFIFALFGSPLIFAVWLVYQDKKNFRAIKEARALKEGTQVEILRLSQTGINYGSKPSSIPIRCNNENLILTGRNFLSVRVALKLTKDGGSGLLWETILGETRLGWLESKGEEYWGTLNPEVIPSLENEPQEFGGA